MKNKKSRAIDEGGGSFKYIREDSFRDSFEDCLIDCFEDSSERSETGSNFSIAYSRRTGIDEDEKQYIELFERIISSEEHRLAYEVRKELRREERLRRTHRIFKNTFAAAFVAAITGFLAGGP